MNKKILEIIILIIIVIVIAFIFYLKKYTNNTDIMVNNLEKPSYDNKNVTITILTETITEDSVEILITDNRGNFSWGDYFKVQTKTNDNWEDLKLIKDNSISRALAYKLDKNNQLKMKINYSEYYGKLEKGIYRIAKEFQGTYFYSDEFKIK